MIKICRPLGFVLCLAAFAVVLAGCQQRSQARFTPEQIGAWLDSIPAAAMDKTRDIFWNESLRVDVQKLNGSLNAPSQYLAGGDGQGMVAVTGPCTQLNALRLGGEGRYSWYLFSDPAYVLVACWDGRELVPCLERFPQQGPGDETNFRVFFYDTGLLHIHSRIPADDPDGSGWGFQDDFYTMRLDKLLNHYDNPTPFADIVAGIRPLPLPVEDKDFSLSFKGLEPLPLGNYYFQGDSRVGEGMAPFYPFGCFTQPDGTVCILGNYVTSTRLLPDMRLYLFDPGGGEIGWMWLKQMGDETEHERNVWAIAADGTLTLREQADTPQPDVIADAHDELRYKYPSSLVRTTSHTLSRSGIGEGETLGLEYRDDFFRPAALATFFAALPSPWEDYKYLFTLPSALDAAVYAHLYKQGPGGSVSLLTATPSGEVIDASYVFLEGVHHPADSAALLHPIPREWIHEQADQGLSPARAGSCGAIAHIGAAQFAIHPDGRIDHGERQQPATVIESVPMPF